MRILIAEDDFDSRRLLKVRLQTVGHEVMEAEDGEAAWELFQRERARLVITDWMMPKLDGIELIRRIRAVGESGYTYIIMLSALDEKQNVVMGLEIGADEYLTKPFHPKELLARVAAGERILKLEETLTESQRQMTELAMRDGLTNVLNRRAAEEHLRAEFSRAARQSSPLSVLLVDIDQFKLINDKYGHPIGDKAIRHAADMLVQYVRPYDWVGRWGGEEFLLTLPGADANGAAQAAERIRCNIAEQPLTLENGLVLPFRVSVGVACASPETATADELVRLADEALYRAKREGRDRVCVHRAS
ncbi:MAG TPA: diguanylate cyclase [Anaerolineales bacterium]|nr:diguanylate cyclase [Anaerolineales bacterium]HLF00733.1 diguanylate cyclase [Anaerolineales bacterium]